MTRYISENRHVLYDDQRLCTATSKAVAQIIAAAMNAYYDVSVPSQPGLPLDDNGPLFDAAKYSPKDGEDIRSLVHHVQRQNDEYACSCGARWDYGDDIDAHP